MAVDAPPPAQTEGRYYEAPNLLYEVAFQKWKQQQADIEGLDRKGFSVFTVASGALVAVLGIIRLRPDDIPEPSRWISVLALLAFMVAAGFILRVVWPLTFNMGPTSRELEDFTNRYKDDDLRGWAGIGFLDGFEKNCPLLRTKSNALGRALVATVAELILAGLALVASFF